MSDERRELLPNGTAPEDRFYRGKIMQLASGHRTGIVRSGSGREIPFVFRHVVMLGPKQRFSDLHVGTEVGFDVSRTSQGLRISVMRIFD